MPSAETLQMMERLEQLRYSNPARAYRESLALREKSQQESDYYLLCFAECQIAAHYVFSGKASHTKLLRQMHHALRLCREYGDDLLLAKAYNLYGYIHTADGEFVSAVECYTKAQQSADTLHHMGLQAVCRCNLGDIFLRMGEYQRALPFLRAAQSYLRKMEHEPRRAYYTNLVEINLAQANLALQKPSKVLGPMETLYQKAHETDPAIADIACCYRCLALAQLGHFEKAAACIDVLSPQSVLPPNLMETLLNVYRHCLRVIVHLQDANRAALMQSLVCHIENETLSPRMVRLCLLCHIIYHEAFGSKDALLDLYRQLFLVQETVRREEDAERASVLVAHMEAQRMREEHRTIAEENKQLQKLSALDELTQLYNRRTLNKKTQESVARAVQQGQAFGILMVDLDHFKTINDTLGHNTGDLIVHAAAQSLLDSDTRYVAARFGGDEFAVLCHGCTNEEIVAYFERVRKRFVALQKAIPMQGLQMKLSGGYYNDVPQKPAINKFFDRADKALYAAKINRDTLINYREIPKKASNV